MNYLLTIDPAGESGGGGHTGVVLAKYDDDTPYTIIDYWHLTAGVNSFRMWLREANLPEDLTVICEDFVQWNPAADISPLKLIGAVQYIWPNVILRQAGRRSFITDDQMKALGAYIAGGHHRDCTESARHGVAWLVKVKRHKPTQKVVFQ